MIAAVSRYLGVEVCGVLLLNLTGTDIDVSLEVVFNSKFLLIFREVIPSSEGWLLRLKPGVSVKTTEA